MKFAGFKFEFDSSSLGASGGNVRIGRNFKGIDVDGGIGFKSFGALKRHLGSPGKGMQWHHIVEQTPGNIDAFSAVIVHNTNNVIAIPKEVHIGKGSISAYYSSKDTFTGGLTVRNWLSTQSFDAQREFELRQLKNYGY